MSIKKSAAALGFFDGVHLGHRVVIKLAVKQEKNGLVPSVFTFNPDAISGRKSDDGYIYSSEEKSKLLSECGIDNIFSVSFEEVCNLSGEEFVKEILIDKMNVGFVCCGNDFRFGKSASYGTDELRKYGIKYGFEVCTADDIKFEGEIVSSTKIRKFLLDGNIIKAHMFLGRPYAINKEVIHGAHLGSTRGFPTVNQIFETRQIVPKFGVYASDVCINGYWYRAITNIGMKPTVNYGGMPLAETYIDGFSGDLYGKTIQVNLCEFIRPEQKFASVDELKQQIAKDIENMRYILL